MIDLIRLNCVNLLPLQLTEALTDYEVLCKVLAKLNETIEQMNSLSVDVSKLQAAFDALKAYVENYFDNLDVQEEINNKLDDMYKAGLFKEIMYGFCPDWFGADTTGTNDCKEAFEMAFTAAKSVGGIVFLNPESKYKLTQQVMCTTSLFGNGAQIITDNPVLETGANYDESNEFQLYWKGVDNFVVNGLNITDVTFDQYLRPLYPAKVAFSNCNHFELTDYTFNSQSYAYSVPFDVYASCMFFNIERVNVYKINSAKGGSWIRACYPNGITQYGTVKNCNFTQMGGDESLAIWAQEGTVQNIVVEDCYFNSLYVANNYQRVLLLAGGTVGTSQAQKVDNITFKNCKLTCDYVPRTIVNMYPNAGTNGVVRFENFVFEVAGTDYHPTQTVGLLRGYQNKALYDHCVVNVTTDRRVIDNCDIINECVFTGQGNVAVLASNRVVDSVFNDCLYYGTVCRDCQSIITVTKDVIQGQGKYYNCRWEFTGTGIKNFLMNSNGYLMYCHLNNLYLNSSTGAALDKVNAYYCFFDSCTASALITAPEITTRNTYNAGLVNPPTNN